MSCMLVYNQGMTQTQNTILCGDCADPRDERVVCQSDENYTCAECRWEITPGDAMVIVDVAS